MTRSKERETAMRLLVTKLMERAIPQVKSQLSDYANYCVDQEGVRRLATLCAQGPYEETQLRLEEYDEQRLTWEPEWNIVESLPANAYDKNTRTLSPVCAAFRGTNGVTIFAFISEHGSIQATTRWVDCALHTASGRSLFMVQNIQLEKLFLEFGPPVIAVAAFGSQSLGLMRTLQTFVKTRLNRSTHARVSLIWAPTEVARYCSETSFANTEMPHVDSSTRTCVFLARYVQDPLFVLSTLFDAEKTAVQLFSICSRLTKQRADELYSRLCWEMSLWTSATGFWVEDCVKRPNSVALLQFVAGLGPFKGQDLFQTLSQNQPASRADVLRTLESSFDEYVARNAVNSLFVAPPAPSSNESRGWNPLDATLIPLHWRPMVEFFSKALLDSAELGRVAALKLISMDVNEKRSKVYGKDTLTLLNRVRSSLIECRNEVGEREVELMLDEIVSGTKSYLRRPFRKLSSHELMISVTGLVYVASQELKSTYAMAGRPEEQTWRNALVLRKGDYITGTIAGIRGSSNPGIRVLTSRGAGAFLSADSINDEALRMELLSHIRTVEQRRQERRSNTGDDVYYAPAWLTKGSPIQGTVTGCMWTWCELKLDWCPPQTYDVVSEKTFDPLPSYNSIIKDNVSSVNSLKTVQIEQETIKFSTKISRHSFFRDVFSKSIQELLRDKEIGETLLCPSRRVRNGAVCVVKVGAHSMCNWLVKEKRRQDGGIYYLLKDDVIDAALEFNEVDELLSNYIQPLVSLTRLVRQHRRFLENADDVSAYFSDPSRSQNGLLYAFVETGKSSRPYCVITKGAKKNHVFPLYFTNKHIYIRLPFVDVSRTVSEKWVKCENAEVVSVVVKEHARALYTQSNSD
ncbi:hypothetical protein STCU_09211 [Strigomonas culicis]|uniref:Spt6 SH2 domain-containing protein n=1 Tax=Strigomonas culicis TaxID=28005 RepID=S9TNX0_9TRYP|nr:hypothetical protein STCU_09211 [Strigomonas culicis]|eukprot:EPY19977.1 hypothetical protein STCU_09211 [Strigomonas culicis]